MLGVADTNYGVVFREDALFEENQDLVEHLVVDDTDGEHRAEGLARVAGRVRGCDDRADVFVFREICFWRSQFSNQSIRRIQKRRGASRYLITSGRSPWVRGYSQ